MKTANVNLISAFLIKDAVLLPCVSRLLIYGNSDAQDKNVPITTTVNPTIASMDIVQHRTTHAIPEMCKHIISVRERYANKTQNASPAFAIMEHAVRVPNATHIKEMKLWSAKVASVKMIVIVVMDYIAWANLAAQNVNAQQRLHLRQTNAKGSNALASMNVKGN